MRGLGSPTACNTVIEHPDIQRHDIHGHLIHEVEYLGGNIGQHPPRLGCSAGQQHHMAPLLQQKADAVGRALLPGVRPLPQMRTDRPPLSQVAAHLSARRHRPVNHPSNLIPPAQRRFNSCQNLKINAIRNNPRRLRTDILQAFDSYFTHPAPIVAHLPPRWQPSSCTPSQNPHLSRTSGRGTYSRGQGKTRQPRQGG